MLHTFFGPATNPWCSTMQDPLQPYMQAHPDDCIVLCVYLLSLLLSSHVLARRARGLTSRQSLRHDARSHVEIRSVCSQLPHAWQT